MLTAIGSYALSLLGLIVAEDNIVRQTTEDPSMHGKFIDSVKFWYLPALDLDNQDIIYHINTPYSIVQVPTAERVIVDTIQYFDEEWVDALYNALVTYYFRCCDDWSKVINIAMRRGVLDKLQGSMKLIRKSLKTQSDKWHKMCSTW